jgi:DNA-binding PadR family transcriptional regulator
MGVQQNIVLQILNTARKPLTVAQIQESRPQDFELGSILKVVYNLRDSGFIVEERGVISTYRLTNAGRDRLATVG